jgi:hypothetical protein
MASLRALKLVWSICAHMPRLRVGEKMTEARERFNDGVVKTQANRGDDVSGELSRRYGSR